MLEALLGFAAGMGVMLVAIICYKMTFLGYTVKGGEPSIWEVSTHKILSVDRIEVEGKETEWLVRCEKAIDYRFPESTIGVIYVDLEEDVRLERIFQRNVLIRKRWFHKDKIEYLPSFELVIILHVMREKD